MTSKQNIQLQLDGISACDLKDYAVALDHFNKISSPSAQIFFNVGSCYLMLHKSREAVAAFRECISRDKYMAIGHFRLGVAQMLCEDYTGASKSFQNSISNLRGNPFLDYKQLNLPCKLYASEVNFNLGLAHLFSGDYDSASYYMQTAGSSTTENSRHSVFSGALDAIQRENWNYFGRAASDKMIRLSDKAFFRVSKDKIEGLKSSTDFLGKAKVVSAVNDEYSFVGFVGARKLQETRSATPPPTRKVGGSAGIGPPPSVPPPRRPPPSLKSPDAILRNNAVTPPRSPVNVPRNRREEASNPVSELQAKFDGKLSLEGRSTTPHAQAKKPGEVDSYIIPFHCDLNLELSKEASFKEVLQKLEEKLGEAAADVSLQIQQKQMSLTLEKRLVSNSTEWNSAWLSTTHLQRSNVTLCLKENYDGMSSSIPAKSQSPGYKPSRPPPHAH